MKHNIFSVKALLALITVLAIGHLRALAPVDLKNTTLLPSQKTLVLPLKTQKTFVLSPKLKKPAWRDCCPFLYARSKHILAIKTNEATSPKKLLLPVWLQYGLLFGAVFNESHITENYARYGNQGHATIKLLCELFNVTTPDFRISDLNNRPGNFLSPEQMGLIFRYIYESEMDDNPVVYLENALTEKICKNFTDEQRDACKKFVTNLIGSLNECNYWGNNTEKQLYPENTLLNLLHGFVYKKAETRADLKDFFNGLCSGCLEGTNPSTKMGWETDIFKKEELAELTISFKNMNNTDVSKIETLACAGIVTNWTDKSMPCLFDYGSAYPTDSKNSFPDCVESSLRNICNIYAFNEKTGTFSSEVLQKNLYKKAKLPLEVKEFYNKNGGNKNTNSATIPWSENALDKQYLHNEWLNNVLKTNRDYVMYTKTYDGKNFASTHHIYIPTSDKSEITIDGIKRKILVYNIQKVGYEIDAYTSNLIIILDTILGLNLFEGKNIENELAKGDFVSTYIKLLANALKSDITINRAAQKDIITVTTPKNQMFTIEVTNGRHVAISLMPSKNGEWIKTTHLKKLGKNEKNQPPEILLLLTHAFNLDSRELKSIKDINQSFFLRGRLFLNDGKISCITNMAEQIKQETLKKNFYQNLIKNILNTFTFVEGDWNDYEKLIKKTQSFLPNNSDLKELVFNPLYKQISDCKNWNPNDPRWKNFFLGMPNSLDEALLYSIKKLNFSEKEIIFKLPWSYKDARKPESQAALFKAVVEKSENIADFLTKPNGDDANLLMYHAKLQNAKCVELILGCLKNFPLEAKRKIFIQSSELLGNILMIAIENGLQTQALLNIVKDLDDKDKTEIFTQTSYCKNIKILTKELIESKEAFLKNVLMIAIEKRPEVTKDLLDITKTLGNETIKKIFTQTADSKNVLMIAIEERSEVTKDMLGIINTLGNETIKKIFTSKYGKNALMIAIEAGSNATTDLLNIIKTLDEKTISEIFTSIEYGKNALMMAIEKESKVTKDLLDIIKTLDNEAKKKIFTQKSSDENALMMAIEKKSKVTKDLLEIIKTLDDEAKKKIFTQKSSDENALMMAVKNGNTELINVILDFIKSLGTETAIEILTEGSYDDKNALMTAVEKGNTELINVILDFIKSLGTKTAIKILSKKSKNNNNVLMISANKQQYANPKVTKILLDTVQNLGKEAMATILSQRNGYNSDPKLNILNLLIKNQRYAEAQDLLTIMKDMDPEKKLDMLNLEESNDLASSITNLPYWLSSEDYNDTKDASKGATKAILDFVKMLDQKIQIKILSREDDRFCVNPVIMAAHRNQADTLDDMASIIKNFPLEDRKNIFKKQDIGRNKSCFFLGAESYEEPQKNAAILINQTIKKVGLEK